MATKAHILKTPNLLTGTPEQKRAEILAYFNRTFDLDDKLYKTLRADDTFFLRADPLRHPLVFYFGHTASFFVNKLVLAKLLPHHINPRFESIFAIGVDEMSWDDLDERNYDWPTIDEVRSYREQVKGAVTTLIETLPLALPITWESPFWPILMGIEHQNIHIETSSVLIRQLPLERLEPGIFTNLAEDTIPLSQIPKNQLEPIPGGEVTLGKPQDHRFYGWDLEYGEQVETVSPFEAARHLVSNGEFLEFVKAGGYNEESYWTEEGWAWRTFKEAQMPQFWRNSQGEYSLRLMAHLVPMPWRFPAEVNYLEAKAFCNWKAAQIKKPVRLPTEAEWVQMVQTCGVPDVDRWEVAPGNLNLEHYHSPCPVDQFKTGPLYDAVGNVWQWTETPITGYPGFKVHPLYDDFAVPTFDGKHNLFKGGSFVSTGNEATLHARYAFRRHFYQHAGLRYIVSEAPPKIITNTYETDPDVAESCELQYGAPIESNNLLPLTLAELILKAVENPAAKRLLDLNCDTGRVAFALSDHFKEITALDFSARFINPAVSLQKQGAMRYAFKEEGELKRFVDVKRCDLGLKGEGQNIEFLQADVGNLKPRFTGYDVILAVHQLTALRDPLGFLKTIHARLNPGGILIVGSDYNWDESTTPRESWPGGFKRDGEPVLSLDGIRAALCPNFSLTADPTNLTYTKRHSARTATTTTLELTIWQKI